MKTTRLFPIAALALAACGGATSTDQFRANAPTYEKIGIAQNDSDQAAPAQAAPADAVTQDVTAPTCHPHLFQRTGEIIGRVNRHFFKLLHHVEDVIKDNPKVAAGQTMTWEKVKGDLDRPFSYLHESCRHESCYARVHLRAASHA